MSNESPLAQGPVDVLVGRLRAQAEREAKPAG